MKRPICPACNQRPCSVNYHRHGIVHYRGRCQTCINKNRRIRPPEPRWQRAGYKKKSTCDKCGFKAKYSSQLLVFHVDGNQHNCATRNLKTICLNCIQEIKKADLPWQPGDLELDG